MAVNRMETILVEDLLLNPLQLRATNSIVLWHSVQTM